MINELLIALAGGIIGGIVAWIGITYQNKRWIFTPSIDIRTKSILEAYEQFLKAFFNINKAANVGEEETSFQENITQPLNDYLIAINKIDIWVNEESSKELREILGTFRKFSHEIFVSKGKQPPIKSSDWKTFSDSLEKVKSIVSREIRSQELRKFIFSVK